MTFDRSRFLKIVRTWKNTKWRHGIRIKGVGADCIGFIVGSLEEYHGTKIDMPVYASRIVQQNSLQKHLEDNFKRTIEPKPGDIMLFRFGHVPHHVGIYTGEETMIHAYNRGEKKIIEEPISHGFLNRLVCYFDISTRFNF